MSCFKTAIQICFCLISSTHSPSVDQLSGVEEFKNLDPARVCLCVWVCLSRTQTDDEIAFPAAASQTKPCRVLIAMISMQSSGRGKHSLCFKNSSVIHCKESEQQSSEAVRKKTKNSARGLHAASPLGEAS